MNSFLTPRFDTDDVVVMFTGQGRLEPGMGKRAHQVSENAQRVFETASRIAQVNLMRVCFGDMTDKLSKHPQMALAAASRADYEFAKENGLTQDIDAMKIGLSAGEMTALGASDVRRR
jgi:malonyl CoA-acyl carrier protein transacylase